MKNITIAALAAAALLIPAAANADAMTADHAMMSHGAPATMLCRPAMNGEKPNAMMSAPDAPLVCKAMPVMPKGTMMGPKMTKDLSAQQIDAAWRDWLDSQVSIPQGG